MFYGCSSLTTLDLSKFNTANVTDMKYMFYECSSLSTLNISSFNTAKVTDMSHMFTRCSSLTTLNLSNFNTAKVSNMGDMFYGCNGLTTLNTSSFNTEKVTGMSGMFYGCSGITSLDLSGFNTAKVTNMSAMFYGCSSLTTLDLSKFNTANVTDMSLMFYACRRLTTLALSHFNTAKVTTMNAMFHSCGSLTTLDISNFNTAMVTDMSTMFQSCGRLTSLDLSSFNTAMVTSMKNMFICCSNLTSLDLSTFATSKVTDMSEIFSRCSNIAYIIVDKGWSTQSVNSSDNMFQGCDKLYGSKGTHCVESNISYAHIDGGTENPGYFTKSGETIFKKIIAIKISTFPKTEYTEGDDFSAENGILTLTYNTGDTKTISLSEATITEYDKTKVGKQYVKIQYQDVETYMSVTVKIKKAIASISVTTSPKKLYTQGDDFSAENGILTLIYNTGDKETINLSEATITGYDKTKVGEQTLNVEYQGIETTLKVTVKVKKALSSISVTTSPITVYALNEDFSTKYGLLTLTYNTGETETVALSDATITGYDKTTAGEQTLKVEYQGKETTLKVTVSVPTPVSTITNSPSVKVWSSNRTIYIESAPDTKYTIIDLSGRTLKSSATSSSKEEIRLNKSGIVVVIINGESYKLAL